VAIGDDLGLIPWLKLVIETGSKGCSSGHARCRLACIQNPVFNRYTVKSGKNAVAHACFVLLSRVGYAQMSESGVWHGSFCMVLTVLT